MKEKNNQAEKPRFQVRRFGIAFYLTGLVLAVGLITSAVSSFTFASYQVEQAKTLIRERDHLFAETIVQSIDVFLESNVIYVQRFAREIEGEKPGTHQEVVRQSAASNPNFHRLFLADADGVVYADFAPRAESVAERTDGIGVQIADRAYFKEAISSRQPVISEVVLGRATGAPVVVVVVPLMDDGQVVGVAGGSLDLGAISQIASSSLGEEIAQAVVIDQHDHVIVHPDSGAVAELASVAHLEPTKLLRSTGEDGFLESYEDLDGHFKSAWYEPVPELGWGVWVAQDAGQFRNIYWRAAGPLLLYQIAIYLIFAGLIVMLVPFLLHPLYAITKTVRKMKEGNLDARVEFTSWVIPNELQEIGDQVNASALRMAKDREQNQALLDVKSKFLTVVTHVFRTPLTILQWSMQLMEERNWDGLAPDLHPTKDNLREGANRLSDGFENVFQALAIQNQSVLVNVKSVSVLDQLDRVLQNLEWLIQARNLTIVPSFSTIDPFPGDESKIYKIIQVVLSNACYYSEEKGTVEVHVARGNGSILFDVVDYGIGISRAEQKQLFEPFFRGERAKLKHPDGAGLGLFIARAYVEAHGGSITVSTSRKKRQTTVSVKIPITLSIE